MSPRRKRALIVIAAIAAAVLVVPAAAFAAGGSGSAGFSSGGGGGGFGGGGGGGGGKGFAIYLIFRAILDVAIWGHGKGLIVLAVLALIYFGYTRFWPRFRANMQARQERGRTSHRKTRERERKVELAAAEAADENPLFDPDHVRTSAAALFTQIQNAWDQDDRIRLRGLLSQRLAAEWERRLDDLERRGWRNHVELLTDPDVEYVGLKNSDPETPTVTVLIEAKLRDYVVDQAGRHIKRSGQFTETTRLREYWTLENRNGHWVLASIEQGSEGSHQLKDKVVQTEWADEQALRDEALLETTNATENPGELINIDLSADAEGQAKDLSVQDGRFSPDILEIAARRAVDAWSSAVDGSTEALKRMADPEIVDQLLYPGDPSHRARLVVRGIDVKQIHVAALDPSATPPTMTIDVTITGRRYIQDRNTTAVLAGSSTQATTFTERWTLALGDDAAQPWRIVGAAVAAPR